MNTNELKQYLKHVKMLEARAYEMKGISDRLQARINALSNREYTKQKRRLEPEEISFQDVFNIMICGIFLGAIIGLIVGMTKETGFILFRLFKCKQKYLGYGILWGAITGIIVTIIYHIYDVRSTNKRNAIIAKDNINISKNNDAMKKQDEQKIAILKTERGRILTKYHEIMASLDKAYKLNILHPKYQNIVAVCSLYEYVDSGRCTQLAGHEGGYNIFETEKRMNMICIKLDEVINKLNQIQENQQELYYVINNSNKNIDRMCNQISTVSDRLGNIENNQILMDYNTRVAADNSEFIKWLAYFRS